MLDSGIHALDVKEEIANYSYLYKRHADLALKLAEVLLQMKWKDCLNKYMPQAQQRFVLQE